MRLFVAYGKERLRLDVMDGKTIYDVKEIVRDAFMIGPDEGPAGVEMQEKKLLTLTYAGADLDDRWVVADIGINPGSTLRAVLKDEVKPSMYVYSAFNEETVPLFNKINFHEVTVGGFRGMVSRKTGLPVGVFRLLNADGVEMFDYHTLDNYDLDLGHMVRLESWDGWNDFLNLSIMGFATLVKDKLSSNEVEARFQMKVALYIAAHFGHVDLAVTLLRLGIRADEPIGDHPMRQWCQKTNRHIDSYKAPVHEAAEAGQLGVLRSFVHHNVCNVLARDGNDLTPLSLTLRFKQKPCASFLLTKQWSKVNYTKKSSLPLSIYTKMKRWGDRAKDKCLVMHGQWKSSIKNPRRHVQTDALVGYGVQLDGFSRSKLTSKSSEEVLLEEEQEAKRKKRQQMIYEESKPQDKNEIQMDPETYFKSMGMLHALKLPRLSRWGRAMSKAAVQQEKKLRLVSETESESNPTEQQSGTESSSNGSPEPRKRVGVIGSHRPRSSSLGKEGRTVKLPPIKEKNLQDSKHVSVSHQNLSTGNKTEPEFHGKQHRSVFLRTGLNKGSVSPSKLSTSSHSLSESPRLNKHAKDSQTTSQDFDDPQNSARKKKKNRSVKSAILMKKARTGDGAIALPMVSVENNPRPFINKNEDFPRATLDLYERYRGLRSRDYAIKCLTLANTFKDRPWLSQVHQAMVIASQGVKRVIAKEPHLFTAELRDSGQDSNISGSTESVATF